MQPWHDRCRGGRFFTQPGKPFAINNHLVSADPLPILCRALPTPLQAGLEPEERWTLSPGTI
jgi:hypothetical protein